MIRHCSGIVCVATTAEVLSRLGLGPMVAANRDRHRTDFAISVDAAEGVTTGISAADRARTIRIIGDPDSRPGAAGAPGPRVSPSRAARAVFSSAPATRRPPSTWRSSPASTRAACCASS